MSQGQPRVIILTVFVVLSYHMLYTQFQGHQSYLVLEKKIFKVFTIYGRGGHVGHATWLFE